MTGVQRTIAACLGIVAVVIGLFVYSVMRTPTLSDAQLKEMGVFILPTPREISEFALTSHRGEPFTLEDLEGRWTFAFFGFTNCPDICPTSMSVLGQAQTRLSESDAGRAGEFQGLMVTVDPERDTLDRLSEYVGAFSSDLIGVRGDLDTTAGFAKELHVAFAKVPVLGPDAVAIADAYQVDHTANVVIINPHGHYHGFIKYPQQPDNIAATFETLAANF